MNPRLPLIVALFVMTPIVLFEGFVLAMSGVTAFGIWAGLAPYEHLAWWVLFFATAVYLYRPIFAVIIGWLFFLIFAYIGLRTDDEQRLAASWFLYQHSLELIYIVASNVGFLLCRFRTRRFGGARQM